jgi:hypothetical protein
LAHGDLPLAVHALAQEADRAAADQSATSWPTQERGMSEVVTPQGQRGRMMEYTYCQCCQRVSAKILSPRYRRRLVVGEAVCDLNDLSYIGVVVVTSDKEVLVKWRHAGLGPDYEGFMENTNGMLIKSRYNLHKGALHADSPLRRAK